MGVVSLFTSTFKEYPQPPLHGRKALRLSGGSCPPGRGGGHCLFGGSYPLPNYQPHCSRLSTPEFSLTVPYFWEFETTTFENKTFSMQNCTLR